MSNDRRFSTSFKDHAGLLHRFAKGGYARLMNAGVSIDYEDVFQEMCVGYVKAAEKYKPDSGINFSTYMGRAVINNFNKYAEKELNTHFRLGLISVQALEIEDGSDAYEFLETEDDTPTIADMISASQEMKLKSRFLTKNAKSVIRELIKPSKKLLAFQKSFNEDMIARKERGEISKAMTFDDISIRLIVRFLDLKLEERARLRTELKREFGIEY